MLDNKLNIRKQLKNYYNLNWGILICFAMSLEQGVLRINISLVQGDNLQKLDKAARGGCNQKGYRPAL